MASQRSNVGSIKVKHVVSKFIYNMLCSVGLTGDVLVDHDTVEHWTLYTLDFTPAYINR